MKFKLFLIMVASALALATIAPVHAKPDKPKDCHGNNPACATTTTTSTTSTTTTSTTTTTVPDSTTVPIIVDVVPFPDGSPFWYAFVIRPGVDHDAKRACTVIIYDANGAYAPLDLGGAGGDGYWPSGDVAVVLAAPSGDPLAPGTYVLEPHCVDVTQLGWPTTSVGATFTFTVPPPPPTSAGLLPGQVRAF